jgi:hypothetical protein
MKNSLIALFVLTALGTTPAYGEEYALIWDEDYSPAGGAGNLVSLYSGLEALSRSALPDGIVGEGALEGPAGAVLRLATTLAVDYPLAQTAASIQHKVFGHGARLRQFDARSVDYDLGLPFPYGRRRGATRAFLDEDRTGDERTTVQYGGLEGTRIMARMISRKWAATGAVNSSEALLYLVSSGETGAYALLAGEQGIREFNDITEYVRSVNEANGFVDPAGYALTLRDIRRRAWIALANPVQLAAVHSYISGYIWKGATRTTLPAIRLGEIGYLPALYLGLTPFGSEMIVENTFARRGKVLIITYRHGDGKLHDFNAVELEAHDLLEIDGNPIGFGVHLWRQPPLRLGGDRVATTAGGAGGALYGQVRISTARAAVPVSLTLKAGYKTAGYMEGEHLSSGPLFRLGLRLGSDLEPS